MIALAALADCGGYMASGPYGGGGGGGSGGGGGGAIGCGRHSGSGWYRDLDVDQQPGPLT